MSNFTAITLPSLIGAARNVYPGLLVAITIGLAAQLLSLQYGAPVMLLALILGMAFNFLGSEPKCAPGIDFVCIYVLRTGIVLLGVRITFEQIGALGTGPILIVLLAVTTTILAGWTAAKLMKLGPSFGLITGGSVAICGATAALAIASVLPNNNENDRTTALTVVTVTAFSTLAMILYPILSNALDLNAIEAGLFLGGTIHDIAQVIGAGYTVSQESGDIATYTKLMRVSLLLPVVLAVAFLAGSQKSEARVAAPPFFLIAFVAVVSINSAGLLSPEFSTLLSDSSRWMLVTALASLGARSSLHSLTTIGWKPIAVLLIETIWIAGAVFCGIRLT